jgi:hypothetical protein
MADGRHPPAAPSDDPTGGRRLTHRLKVALPAAFLIGAAVALPVGIAASDWRPVVAIAAVVAALTGTVVAAIEDGRVQRRIDAARPRPADPGLRAARRAALAGDDEAARLEIARALMRGASPDEIAAGIDHPRWPRERVGEIEHEVNAPY